MSIKLRRRGDWRMTTISMENVSPVRRSVHGITILAATIADVWLKETLEAIRHFLFLPSFTRK